MSPNGGVLRKRSKLSKKAQVAEQTKILRAHGHPCHPSAVSAFQIRRAQKETKGARITNYREFFGTVISRLHLKRSYSQDVTIILNHLFA